MIFLFLDNNHSFHMIIGLLLKEGDKENRVNFFLLRQL